MTLETSSPASAPAIADEIDNLHRQLESLARSGKWSDLTPLMNRRDALLPRVTDNGHRATLFRAAIRTNECMLKLARADSQAVAHQLTELRRRREVTRRYESHREAGNLRLNS